MKIAYVLNSNGNSYPVSNTVLNSAGQAFDVADEVLNSAGQAFGIFSEQVLIPVSTMSSHIHTVQAHGHNHSVEPYSGVHEA